MEIAKLNIVWVFVQLIFCPRWAMNQLKRTPNNIAKLGNFYTLIFRIRTGNAD